MRPGTPHEDNMMILDSDYDAAIRRERLANERAEASEARATELAAQLATAQAEITDLKYWLDVAKNRINDMLQEDRP